jgi:hypothetical protein
VPTSCDGATSGADQHEDEADNEQKCPNGHEDAQASKEAQNKKHCSDDDHASSNCDDRHWSAPAVSRSIMCTERSR